MSYNLSLTFVEHILNVVISYSRNWEWHVSVITSRRSTRLLKTGVSLSLAFAKSNITPFVYDPQTSVMSVKRDGSMSINLMGSVPKRCKTAGDGQAFTLDAIVHLVPERQLYLPQA
jgi:hypothetical protein